MRFFKWKRSGETTGTDTPGVGSSTSSAEKKKEKKSERGILERPPKDCEGYPPALLPSVPDDTEIDFYVPIDSSNPNNGRLACTLIKRPCGSTSSSSSSSSTPTHVKEGNFTIDSSKPVVVLCHGSFSWRNQMFLAHLAYGISEPLDCHTLRFDFRGNASSSGEFLFGGNARELEDLRCIIRFIRQTMLCDVLCVLGHSKAVYTVLKVAAAQEETQRDGVPGIPCFINMSGRYAVPHNFDPSRTMTPDQMKTLRETGRVVLMTRGHRTNEITTADVEERNRQDSSFVGRIRSSRVLTIHGEKDATIGVADNARKYEEVMGKHNQNHTLRIVKGADHNYNGLRHMKELVSIVTEFLS